jgi:uncharacterized protein
MNKYRRVFQKRNTFLAVIHVENTEQAVRNAILAKENGVDGVFLINHNIGYVALLHAYVKIICELPHFWVGLNFLDLGRRAVAVMPQQADGLWVDNAGISEHGDNPIAEAVCFNRSRESRGWNGLYFGGVAFKYQDPVADVAAVARLAVPYVDVVTTSGNGTGQAADLDKIIKMKAAIGKHPLAVASGITPENVLVYAPYVDCFLVATGISHSHTELDSVRVRALAGILNKK